MKKTDLLREIKNEVLRLKRSPLYKERVKTGSFPVIGEGDHNAKIMFIGEAPGAREAATGRPFCGSAGKILDECLEKINLKRGDAYITNILKDRPPKNRDPLPEEIDIYLPFLKRQINIIQPEIVVSLGRFSAECILENFNKESEIIPITKLHGKVIPAKSDYGEIKILPLLHPAVAIYGKSRKGDLLKGFDVLKKILESK